MSKIERAQKIQTTKYCFACKKTRTNGKLVMFVPRMETYCKDIDTCNNRKAHIYTLIEKNSSLPEYQSKPVACRFEEIFEESKSYFGELSEEHKALFGVIGKVTSVRFDTYQTMYLLKYKKDRGFESMREVMYDIMDRVMREDEHLLKKVFIVK